LLAGGEGNDRLEGEGGDDLYFYERRGGHDVIEETGGYDTLVLGAEITADRVRLSRRHDDLVVDIKGRDGSVTVRDWFASDSAKVETIEFADGTVWGVEDIRARSRRKQSERRHDDDDDHGSHHGWRDDHRHGKSGGLDGEDRDDDRSGGRAENLAELLDAYLADKPRYDFEVLERELERSERCRELLDAREIARRWQAVARFANALSQEHDEDACGAALHRFTEHALLGGGASGGGFGYAGSTGMARGTANLRTLQGLEEGFLRLRV
jgi:hypothetical protein